MVTIAVNVPVAGKLAEEQTWQAWLTGQETDDIGGKAMYLKIGNAWATHVVEYSVRFSYKIVVRLTIMKKKGAGIYKNGTITTASVMPTPSFDPTIFFVKSWNCPNCSKVYHLTGTNIGGKVVGNAVQFSWPRIIPNVTVEKKLKLQWTAKDESRKDSMTGYSNNEFFSERFFDYAGTRKLPLQDIEHVPTPLKQKSANDQFRQQGRHPIHMYHRYTMKRLK